MCVAIFEAGIKRTNHPISQYHTRYILDIILYFIAYLYVCTVCRGPPLSEPNLLMEGSSSAMCNSYTAIATCTYIHVVGFLNQLHIRNLVELICQTRHNVMYNFIYSRGWLVGLFCNCYCKQIGMERTFFAYMCVCVYIYIHTHTHVCKECPLHSNLLTVTVTKQTNQPPT